MNAADWKCALCVAASAWLGVRASDAATLTGSFNSINQGAVINLTSEGTLDWIHWGLQNETTWNRKATVPAQITDFAVLYNPGLWFAQPYRFTDNFNGYTWSDGFQTPGVTNTTSGVYVVGAPAIFNSVNGFELKIPATTTLRTAKIYVGAYGARGKFEATLPGAPTYTATNLVNMANGPSGVYTLNFAADTPGQTLTIRWTVLSMFRLDGNVTLQAATLSASGSNNPPYTVLGSPTNNAKFSAGANITLSASATDFDGSISKVEFFQNGTKLGEDTTAPYSLTWNSVPAGRYGLTARATDNGNASSTSWPVEVFVHGSGGSLSASRAAPPSSVDLTTEGGRDWVHWGLENPADINRKAAVTQQISNFTRLGTNMVERFTDNTSAFVWSDGTPVASTNTTTGLYLSGITNGFLLTLPAGTNTRTLKIYTGVYGARGNLQAYLSDFSAPAFTDTSLNSDYNTVRTVYLLSYSSASAGQTLFIRYSSGSLFDMDFGNVDLSAATLAETGAPPATTILNPAMVGDRYRFSFQSQPGWTYAVQYTDSLHPISWQSLTNISGDGSLVNVTNVNPNSSERFYRVQTQ